jgi:hypothetical protein
MMCTVKPPIVWEVMGFEKSLDLVAAQTYALWDCISYERYGL